MPRSQGAATSIAAAAADEPLPALYLAPYYTTRWLPALELAGPFFGAQPALSKPEHAGQEELAREAERLWRWGEAALEAARVG